MNSCLKNSTRKLDSKTRLENSTRKLDSKTRLDLCVRQKPFQAPWYKEYYVQFLIIHIYCDTTTTNTLHHTYHIGMVKGAVELLYKITTT